MTTLIQHTPKTRRERFVLWLIRRLIPATPLVVNVSIGPDYASVASHDGRTILADRIVFDVSDFERVAGEAAREAGS